jgi:hypothetical protein
MKFGDVALHVVLCLTTALGWWLATRPARVDPFDGAQILAYNWVFRVFAWLGLLLGVGAGLLGFLVEGVANAGAAVILALFVLGYGGLALYAILDFTCTRIYLTDRSITSHVLWRTPRTIAWDDVVVVHYSGVARWFVLEGREGETIRASAYLTGIGALAQEIRSRVPNGIYEKAVPGFAVHNI